MKRMPAILAIVLLAYGCAGEGEPQAPVVSPAEAERAREIFLDSSCDMCHGEQAEGVEEAGPALTGLAPYWTEERLAAYLEDPIAFRDANPDFEDRRDAVYDLEMPSFEHLSLEDRQLLARWLLTN